MSCRLFFDQNISPTVAETLRRLGHDALAVRDVGLLGASDDVLLSFAVEQGRVFISSDYRDFARLAREWNQGSRSFPGIVLVRHRGAANNPGEMLRRIEQHITPDPDRLQNSLTWLPPLQEQQTTK